MRRTASSPGGRSVTPVAEETPELRTSKTGFGRLKRSVTKFRRSNRSPPAEAVSAASSRSGWPLPLDRKQAEEGTSVMQEKSSQASWEQLSSSLSNMETLQASIIDVHSNFRHAKDVMHAVEEPATRSDGRDTNSTDKHASRPAPRSMSAMDNFNGGAGLASLTVGWQETCQRMRVAEAEQRLHDCFPLLKRLREILSSAEHLPLVQRWRLEHELASKATQAVLRLETQLLLGVSDVKRRRMCFRQLLENGGHTKAIHALLCGASARLQRDIATICIPDVSAGMIVDGLHQKTLQESEAVMHLSAAYGQILMRHVVETFQDVEFATLYANININITGRFLGWTVGEVTMVCDAMKQQVLSPRACPAGLTIASRCAAVFLACCASMEEILGIPIRVLAAEALWPAIEGVLERRVRQIQQRLCPCAVTEAKLIRRRVNAASSFKAASEQLALLFPSSEKLFVEIVRIRDAAELAACPSAVTTVKQAILNLVQMYVDALSATATQTGGLVESRDSLRKIMAAGLKDKLSDADSSLNSEFCCDLVDDSFFFATL